MAGRGDDHRAGAAGPAAVPGGRCTGDGRGGCTGGGTDGTGGGTGGGCGAPGVTVTSTRWNSFRSEYPDVAIVRRSAPIRFIEPSATVDGPCTICASVPIVPTLSRFPRGSSGWWASLPQW